MGRGWAVALLCLAFIPFLTVCFHLYKRFFDLSYDTTNISSPHSFTSRDEILNTTFNISKLCDVVYDPTATTERYLLDSDGSRVFVRAGCLYLLPLFTSTTIRTAPTL